MTIEESVKAGLPEGLEESAYATIALELARLLDDGSNSPTSKSMVARALFEALDRLKEQAPAIKGDKVDELRAKRAERHGRGAAGSG